MNSLTDQVESLFISAIVSFFLITSGVVIANSALDRLVSVLGSLSTNQ